MPLPTDWPYMIAAAVPVGASVWWVFWTRPRKREDIAPDVRRTVFRRDGWQCQNPWCGARSHLTIDHIRPLAWGGGNNVENLQTLCRSCNSRKGTSWVPRLWGLRHLWWLRHR